VVAVLKMCHFRTLRGACEKKVLEQIILIFDNENGKVHISCIFYVLQQTSYKDHFRWYYR
jgi:hypothetical protein